MKLGKRSTADKNREPGALRSSLSSLGQKKLAGIALSNFLFMGTTTGVNLLANALLFAILARCLGVEQFGVFMFWFGMATIAAMPVEYGFVFYILREIGADPENALQLVRSGLAGKLALLPLCLIVAACMYLVAATSDAVLPLFALLLADRLLFSFGVYFNIPFRGLDRFEVETRIVTVANILLLCFFFILIVLGAGSIAFAAVFALVRLGFMLMSMRGCCRLLQLSAGAVFTSSVKEVRATLGAAFPYFLDVAVTTLLAYIDVVLVNYFLGSAALGIYQAGMRLYMGVFYSSQVLANVYLPKLASCFKSGRDHAGLATGLLSFMLLAGLAGYVLFLAGARPLTLLFYGEQYLLLADLLPLFGVLLVYRFMAAAHGVMFVAARMQPQRVMAMILSMIVMVAVSIVTVPSMALPGMLVARMASVAVLESSFMAILGQRSIALGFSMANGLGVLLAMVLALWHFVVSLP